jgi:lipoate-protein ligase B
MSIFSSEITNRFDSKEFKAIAKCGSKDAAMKKIFEKIDIGIRQIKLNAKSVDKEMKKKSNRQAENE